MITTASISSDGMMKRQGKEAGPGHPLCRVQVPGDWRRGGCWVTNARYTDDVRVPSCPALEGDYRVSDLGLHVMLLNQIVGLKRSNEMNTNRKEGTQRRNQMEWDDCSKLSGR